ncbi:hypothetical protein KMZ32_10530 [Phycicoccus sp. MAQZ13P-2]|uniref:hypothetical protein n=1 Tax=Phycicoccus mangrovi TaxID=2840470 RepID=UPI001C0004B5|nr:hypothetical protein [Phycicoccus mangrovi]MBT9255910.1 hypothetical protein [Phycicoccus mangrovi]MBT9274504.1 hypothetical protein [Phycicoccus mangrovi]
MSQADPAPVAAGRRGVPVASLAVAAWVVALSFFVLLGSDLLWVVALGDTVRATGGVPEGIPFATAPQDGWHNPVVLAELLLSVVAGLGTPALAALQLVLVAGTLLVVLADGRRAGGSELRGALVVSLVVVGAAAPFAVTRLPSLSLVPFVLAVALMRRQHERPDRGLWWMVPLVALWGNLHGAVLVGLAVLGVFLVLSPGGGPWTRRVGVGAGSAVAALLTPAGLSTPAYYAQALGNEAAVRGTDLWARPSLGHPLDVAMLAAAAVLLALAARARMPLWEWAAAVGLALGTASAARNGVWLLLFLAAAAMRPRAAAEPAPSPAARRSAVPPVALGAAAVVAGVVLAGRGPAVGPPGQAAVGAVREVAAGRPVLAVEPFAETLAREGVRVWAANPVDAFPQAVQAAYLDFLHDGTVPVGADVGVVVVEQDETAPVVADGWRVVREVGGYAVLERDG